MQETLEELEVMKASNITDILLITRGSSFLALWIEVMDN
jgi:hypothetical protein